MACKMPSEKARQKGKMMFMIILTTAMFIAEIVIGYRTGSLALVNDSFNMISAIISLVIGFICLWLSTRENKKNTYGWARVEIWAALVNTVFMLALCFSIFTSAIQRLIEPQAVEEADLVLIIGGVGFIINLIGISVFLNETCDDYKKTKKESQTTCHQHDVDQGQANPTFDDGGEGDDVKIEIHPMPVKRRKMSVTELDVPENWPTLEKCKMANIDSIPEIVTSFEDQVFPSSAIENNSSKDSNHVCLDESDDEDEDCQDSSDDEIDNVVTTVSHIYAGPPVQEDEEIPRKKDKKKKNKKIKSGNQMNIQGVFLHLLGDALGSISVIISGLINKYCQGDWVSRIDPAISLVVVIIIVITTIPLIRQTSNILLQRVPKNVNVSELLEKLKREVKDISNIHDLHVWQLVGTRIIASLHIRCIDLPQYIRTSKQIKRFFHDNGIHSTTIQPEFIEHQESANDRECFLECGPDLKCHADTCCCERKSKQKKISTTSNASGISYLSTDTAISLDSDIGGHSFI